MEQQYDIDEIAFEGPKTPDRGYTIKVSYLKKPNEAYALVEIMRSGILIRKFFFPAYKIYNLQAHFTDIVDSEINNDVDGYEMASWTGF